MLVAKDNTELWIVSRVCLWASLIPEGHEFPLEGVMTHSESRIWFKVDASQGPSRKRCWEIMATNFTPHSPSFSPLLFELLSGWKCRLAGLDLVASAF